MFDVSLKMLLADRRKLLAALVGVAFSVLLINVQGGLFLGLIRKASLLVDHTEADIWVGHRNVHNVDFAKDIPRRWLQRIEGLPGVAQAAPYRIGYQMMNLADGKYEIVNVVGVESRSLLGNAWTIHDGNSDEIRHPNSIIVDICDQDKIGAAEIGDEREIGGVQGRVVARSEGILGFVVTPYVFTSLQTANAMLGKSQSGCSYFLVQAEPDQDIVALRDRIRTAVPNAAVYTREEYSGLTTRFWLTRTGIGISFGAATAIGVFVGLMVLGQSLYANVIDRIRDYGTLLAIGADRSHICRILWTQAFLLATAGILIGLALTFVFQLGFDLPRAPIVIPWQLSVGSCGVTLLSCFVCATIPYFRLRSLDPASIL
jgi:putative ABC transport system permease protein